MLRPWIRIAIRTRTTTGLRRSTHGLIPMVAICGTLPSTPGLFPRGLTNSAVARRVCDWDGGEPTPNSRRAWPPAPLVSCARLPCASYRWRLEALRESPSWDLVLKPRARKASESQKTMGRFPSVLQPSAPGETAMCWKCLVYWGFWLRSDLLGKLPFYH